MQSEKVIEDRLGSVFYHPGASQSEENKPNSIRSYDHEGRMFSIFIKKELVSIDVESIHQDVPRIFSGIDSIPPIEDPFDFYSSGLLPSQFARLLILQFYTESRSTGSPNFHSIRIS